MVCYLLKEIQELAVQQIRFAPREKKIEQSLKAEKLYNEIADSQLYSYRFVCRFITDFRSELHQKLQFPGSGLKHDLILFAEELYNSCNVSDAETDEKVWTLKEICKKYNVSEKTVSRWRKNGLFARRILFGRKKMLGFLEHSVEQFFRRNQAKIHRSGKFSRLSSKEQHLILQAARRFSENSSAAPDTPAGIISTVARFLGRSTETVRLTLQHFEQQNPAEAVFPQKKTLNETEKKDIFRQYQEGIPVHSLSVQYSRSRSNIHWIIAKQRAEQIFALPLKCFPPEQSARSPANGQPDFIQPDFVEVSEHSAHTRTQVKNSEENSAKKTKRLSAEQELSLFRLMNEYKFRASVLRDSLDAKYPKKTVMLQIEEFYGKAAALKKEIVLSFFPLVVSAAKQHLSIGGSKTGGRMDSGLDVMISSGSLTLLQAVETFDYRRGNRFSTYLTWAVAKAFVRFNKHFNKHSNLQTENYTEISDVVPEMLPDYRNNIYAQADEQLETEKTVSQLLKSLDERGQAVIRRRFALGSNNFGGTALQPLSLNETGRELGVSDERIRQIEKTTLMKLKSAAQTGSETSVEN